MNFRDVWKDLGVKIFAGGQPRWVPNSYDSVARAFVPVTRASQAKEKPCAGMGIYHVVLQMSELDDALSDVQAYIISWKIIEQYFL